MDNSSSLCLDVKEILSVELHDSLCSWSLALILINTIVW